MGIYPAYVGVYWSGGVLSTTSQVNTKWRCQFICVLSASGAAPAGVRVRVTNEVYEATLLNISWSTVLRRQVYISGVRS
eukprot:4666885-Pleurochrysis_carterae.AAC.2